MSEHCCVNVSIFERIAETALCVIARLRAHRSECDSPVVL